MSKSKLSVVDYTTGSETGTLSQTQAACGRKPSKDGILTSPVVPAEKPIYSLETYIGKYGDLYEPDYLEFQIWAAQNGEVMV